jgi:hypothetical protein
MKAIVASIALATSVVAFVAPAVAGPLKGLCRVDEVAAFTDRIHIHCSAVTYSNNGTSMANLRYLAVESNSPLAAEAVTLATRAMGQPKQQLVVIFDNDTNKNPGGCLIEDCWRLLGVVTVP